MEKRNRYTAEFKAKVVMELLKEEETLSQIAGKYQLNPQMLSQWKSDFVKNAPSVIYKIMLTDGSEMNVANPTHWPDTPKIDQVLEPFVKASIMVPNDYVGSVMELCQDKRGVFINMEYLSTQRVMITYKLPLAEILYDFFDALSILDQSPEAVRPLRDSRGATADSGTDWYGSKGPQ
jgi:hypothetical protein